MKTITQPPHGASPVASSEPVGDAPPLRRTASVLHQMLHDLTQEPVNVSAKLSPKRSDAQLHAALLSPKKVPREHRMAAFYAPDMSLAELEQAKAFDGKPDGVERKSSKQVLPLPATLQIGMAAAMACLVGIAENAGAREVVAESATSLTFRLPHVSERQTVSFELNELPIDPFMVDDRPMYTLRVVPSSGSLAHKAISQNALSALHQTLKSLGAANTRAADIRVCEADATRHLSKAQLMELFAAPGYEFSWQRAKETSRDDLETSAELLALERSMSAQLGTFYAFPASASGNAKMWAINDLRRAYFFEPLCEMASEQLARILGGRRLPNTWPDKHVIALPARRGGMGELEVSYVMPGSRRADSDIDCTVIIRPDPSLFAVHHQLVVGQGSDAGLLVKMMQSVRGADTRLQTMSASEVFDINFYPEGYLRDANLPAILSPFSVTTPQGLALRAELDRGAALRALMFRVPDLKYEDIGSNDLVLAKDYAILRQLASTHDRAWSLARCLFEPVEVPASVNEVMESTRQNVFGPGEGPLDVLERGQLSVAQRGAAYEALKQYEGVLAELPHMRQSVHAVPIVERARQELVTTYSQRLAALAHERTDVLQRLAEARLASERTGEPSEVHDLLARSEYLALRAVDIQNAIGAEANEAYASASAIRRTVEGYQKGIKQKRSATVAANAAIEETAFVMSYAVPQSVPTKTSTFFGWLHGDKPDAFGAYLLDIAKYVDRISMHIDAIDEDAPLKVDFPIKEGTRKDIEQINAFAKKLVAARDSRDSHAASRIAQAFGIDDAEALRKLCMSMALYGLERSVVHVKQSASTKERHLNVVETIRTLSEQKSAALPTEQEVISLRSELSRTNSANLSASSSNDSEASSPPSSVDNFSDTPAKE